MSEQSDFSEDIQVGWIQWFCGLDDHQFFCEVDIEFILEPFNLYGLKNRIKRFQQALKMILRNHPPAQEEIENPKFLQLYQEATQLYGLIHARYITTPKGMALVRQRFLSGKYGHCPRVMCQKQNVLPTGISQDLKIGRVKIYCPRCDDIYAPRKKFADVDGAFFGTSFPHLLLMSYPDLKPFFKRVEYTPKLFGFQIQKVSQRNENQEKLRMQLPPQPQQQKHQNNQIQSNTSKKNKKKKKN